MGFSRSIEAADPGGRLLRFADILQVCFQDVLHAFLVLPIADEGFQLISEDIHSLLGLFIIYARYTLINKFLGSRIFLVNFSIDHRPLN